MKWSELEELDLRGAAGSDDDGPLELEKVRNLLAHSGRLAGAMIGSYNETAAGTVSRLRRDTAFDSLPEAGRGRVFHDEVAALPATELLPPARNGRLTVALLHGQFKTHRALQEEAERMGIAVDDYPAPTPGATS